MYTENRARDLRLFVKALLSNQLAKYAPSLYVKVTRHTGRGAEDGDASSTAAYFARCVDDYRQELGLTEHGFKEFLRGKTVLEYGPGDVLGVALLLYGYGAERVHCVDRFEVLEASERNFEIYAHVLSLLSGDDYRRAASAFKEAGKPASGLRPEAIQYFVTKDGLSHQQQCFDLIISRAVLEHVNNIEATIADVASALKPGGISVHQVDLSSHGLDRYQKFDFLTWPETAYRLMYSHKGFPNRWRANKYLELVAKHKLEACNVRPTGTVDSQTIERIYPAVVDALRVPHDELAWLGFWMTLRHPASS